VLRALVAARRVLAHTAHTLAVGRRSGGGRAAVGRRSGGGRAAVEAGGEGRRLEATATERPQTIFCKQFFA